MTRERFSSAVGSASLELALITPALLLVLLMMVALGRLGEARADIDAAAAQAARAASVARSATVARVAATAAASATLGARSPCASLDVAVETAAFRPGGQVVVELVCTVPLGQLSGIGLPGTRTLHARSVAVIDTFRGAG